MKKVGFKILGPDMEAIDGMQYELNKLYEYDGNIRCRARGYHYYDELMYAVANRKPNRNRIFECEVFGDVHTSGNERCTNKIKLIWEVTEHDIDGYIINNIDNLVKHTYYRVRLELAKRGFGLDVLVDDSDWIIRHAVARRGFGLSKLVYDHNMFIRLEVAKQKAELDKLVDDKNWEVRLEVAKQGYGLDKLVNDENLTVKCAAINAKANNGL